jgi:hypothetical protein
MCTISMAGKIQIDCEIPRPIRVFSSQEHIARLLGICRNPFFLEAAEIYCWAPVKPMTRDIAAIPSHKKSEIAAVTFAEGGVASLWPHSSTLR